MLVTGDKTGFLAFLWTAARMNWWFAEPLRQIFSLILRSPLLHSLTCLTWHLSSHIPLPNSTPWKNCLLFSTSTCSLHRWKANVKHRSNYHAPPSLSISTCSNIRNHFPHALVYEWSVRPETAIESLMVCLATQPAACQYRYTSLPPWPSWRRFCGTLSLLSW